MVFAILNCIAFALVFIGSLNWGLVGIFDFNLVSAIFGNTQSVGSIIVYVLVLISAIWLLFAIFYQGFKLIFCEKRNNLMDNE